VEDALLRRSSDFEGVHTCRTDSSLGDLLIALRDHRIHRFIVVDEDDRLRGVITLSDIIQYLMS
jgi:5'-AMP-activated protein kinase regulatory gamma subunit